jgi:hypothetical protein
VVSRGEQEVGKLAEELADLDYFITAYREVTGEKLSREERGPDPPLREARREHRRGRADADHP